MSRETQWSLESEADSAAAAKRLRELQDACVSGDIELPKTTRLIARLYKSVQDRLDEAKSAQTRGMGGKYRGWLRSIPTEVAAVIALRECIAQCSGSVRTPTVQTLATSIGKLYETEIRVREAEAVNPVYMRRIHDQVKANATTNAGHLRRLYNVAYDRVMKGVIDSSLNSVELLNLGKFGLDACFTAGILEVEHKRSKNGNLVVYELTEEVREFLQNYSDADVRGIIDRESGAMVCPPDDWSTLHDGGYLTDRRKAATPLMNMARIRRSERKRLREAFTAERMPEVFTAGNYLQSVAFEVHHETFAAIKRTWELGGNVLGVPDKTGPRRPECPMGESWSKKDAPDEELAVFTEWKRAAMKYHNEMRTWRGKAREIGGFLKVTAKYSGPIWFPIYMDRRNRWYYRGTPNPQGSDLAKSCLHFHEKKPLGPRGLFWLRVHIANCYGFDKERFVDREQWTRDNWGRIESALADPWNNPDVFGTDAPWCMYSAAIELHKALSSGSPETYCTGIPIHMDATCSGLQHFSALLRDPTGASCVNLVDDAQCGPKQDIYTKVATAVSASMALDEASYDKEVREMAVWWREQGVARAMAKKPVMTYVYGATLRGTAEFVRDYVEYELKVKFPVPGKEYSYAAYAAKKLFHGIASAVPAAEYAMNWLRSIAREQPRGKRMEWKTPVGFLVQHDYQDYDETRVLIKSCGVQMVLVREFNDSTVPLQMQNAIAPNFVHALDAAHLTMTALDMKSLGLIMVGIHDSFGTHACNVDVMHQSIRESFVKLYRDRNILGEFLWDIGAVGEPPLRGNLDINTVLSSEFFFC